MATHDDEKQSVLPEPLFESPRTILYTAQDEKTIETGQDRQSIHSTQSTIADTTDHEVEERPGLERLPTERKPIVKVPKAERRGLFSRFALIPEVTEPWDYDNRVKWFITFVVAIAAAAAPMGSAIILPALDSVEAEFHSTPAVNNLSVALYMLAMAIFPLWWSAFSEVSGRRTIYLTSFAMFTFFAVLSAVARNITMLVVMRMLSGGAAASVQAVGAGTIADVWESRERGRAMGFFYLGPLCGPLFAPIIGGVVGQRWDWRATQWVLVIWGVLIWSFIFFALPETLRKPKKVVDVAAQEAQRDSSRARPTMSRRSTREVVQNVEKRSRQYMKVIKMFLWDPLKILWYLKYPAVLLTVYYAAVTFGSLYVLNISIQYSFAQQPYEFSTIILGLLYIPNSIGYILASLVGGRWMDHIMKREAIKANRVTEQGKLIYRPEDRMRENAWLGAMLYPVALIWYGWTTEKGVFWFVPILANFFYGFGSMFIFAIATTMLTEFMPKKSSSGVAVNNFCRNIFSCTGAVAGVPLIQAIGNGWLFTILGIWALSSSVCIWAMRHYGPRWREKMDREIT